MRIDIATLFPEMCEAVLQESILGRARKNKLVEVFTHNIRDFSEDKHRHVDDIPYGGGMGMVMQPEPIFKCFEHVSSLNKEKPHVIYLSPKGKVLTQERATQLSKLPRLFLLCGHYEGVDERVLKTIVDEEISIGDYVLTGGELPALVLTDTIVRLCDGVLSSEECYKEESHFEGLLEYPQYTRPQEWHGFSVPEVLISGHHEKIAQYKRRESLKETLKKRPDLLQRAELTDEEKDWLSKEISLKKSID